MAEIPEEKSAQRKSKPAKAEPAANQLGLVLSELTAEQKRELKVPSGVLVEDVRNGMRIDLRAGDVILSVIHKGATTEIRSADQFNKLVSTVEKGHNLTLLVRRGENQLFVTIKAPNER